MSVLERQVLEKIAPTGAGRVLVEWLAERQADLSAELRIANTANFQQVQGRAQEIDRLIKLLTK